MKTLLTLVLLALTFSCAKNKTENYTAILNQTSTNSPVANVLTKERKNQTVVWSRIDTGIYKCDFAGFKSSKPIVFVSETSNPNTQIRYSVNDNELKLFTYNWNSEFGFWESSDDILINTTIELRFYK